MSIEPANGRLRQVSYAPDDGVEPMGPHSLAEVEQVLLRAPLVDVFVANRVAESGLQPWRLPGQLWGYREAGRLVSLCYVGANMVPVQASEAALDAFAERALSQGRTCSSIVGESEAVARLWAQLEPRWGPARELRQNQPVLAATGQPEVHPDQGVRLVTLNELDLITGACIEMFTEEVGVSPLVYDAGASYRSRVAELVRQGRSLARIESGEVLFKAEIGAVSPHACQVQGVWVNPAFRGHGYATPGMVAVVEYAKRHIAPAVQLYVNHYNKPARAVYARAGFSQIATYSSVLW